MMRMEVAWVFLLMHCFAHSSAEFGQFDPVQEWEKLEKVIASETAQEFASKSKFWKYGLADKPLPKSHYVPLFQHVPASKVHMELFTPEKGVQPMPDSVREMLIVTATPASLTPSQPKLMDVLCHIDRVYIRLQTSLFNGLNAYNFLKLGDGKCGVNQATKNHYYLMYTLANDCGFKKQSNVDDFIVSTEVTFQPKSTVMREAPFTIPVQCIYHRFFNSYSTGFYPILQGGTVVKRLGGRTGVSLITQDELGIEISGGGHSYTIGQPVCFEAKLSDQASGAAPQRVYINMCLMSASQNPSSSATYTVINNQGCMIDAKESDQSKFIIPASATMSQKFCIGAFVLYDAPSSSTQQNVQHIYMHCEIFLGGPTSTEGSKACNYDSDSKSWREVNGDDALCSCCGSSSCPSAQPRAFKTMVSSQPWEVQKSSYVEPAPLSETEDYADVLNSWNHDY